MEALAAVGLAGNIIEFIRFSYTIISGINKVCTSASGMTPENESLSILVDDFTAVAQTLITDVPAKTENERQLCALASSCYAFSEEIQGILRRLTVGNNGSKWDGLKVKWRSMRKEREIEAIERRLNGYQTQILIRLHVMFSQKWEKQNQFANGQLAALRSEGKALRNTTTSQLDELYMAIGSLVSSVQSTSAQDKSNGSRDVQLVELNASLSEFQSVTTSLSRQNKVLQRLAFPSMYSREGSIESAESNTFAWMVDENCEPAKDVGNRPTGLEDETHDRIQHWRTYDKERTKQEALRQRTREEFLAWLNSGRYIFHISGKAGSGKSTLMKFLAQSPLVKKELEAWAGGSPLIFVRFFFWNSGDATQMSLEGLYRTLLFETCRQKPDMIPHLFPEIWRDPALGSAPIHLDEVKAAFNRLIKEVSSSESYFCFFIDGLDEFAGDEVDHWRLAQDLQSWTAQAENIKVCVSSRPHIPFVRSFGYELNRQISIHELTWLDISEFTIAMFEKDPNFHRIRDTYKELTIEVVNASDGVFLWARMAVRSLLKGLGYQVSEKELRRKLQLLPKGLDGLFDQILGSIDPDDQHLSDQLFLLTTANFCLWQPIVQNAIAYSWLEDLEDLNFPFANPMQSYTEPEINERLERVGCLLDRLSRGLLEISPKRTRETDGHDYFTHQVQFLHRSARDYIVNTRKAQMEARIPDFDVIPRILRLLLAELKLALPSLYDNRPRVRGIHGVQGGNIRIAVHRLYTVMRSAYESCGYDVPSRLLEEAGRIVEHHSETAERRTEPSGAEQMPGIKGHIWGGNLQRVGTTWCTLRESNHSPDFLCELVYRGLHGFLSPDLLRHLKQQNADTGANLLLVAATSDSLQLVQQLLREGRTPKELVAMEPIYPFGRNWEGLPTIPPSQATNSVWLVFLYRVVESFLLSGHRSHGEKDDTIGSLDEFLRYDVDRDVLFVVRILPSFDEEDDDLDDTRTGWERKLDKGETDERLAFDLVEFLDLAAPAQRDTLSEKLNPQEGETEVTPVCGPTVIHRRGMLSKKLEEIVAAGKLNPHFGYGLALGLESVITPSERLDAPFAFRIS
ncbi:hypothetical protein BJY00DRAFT_265446 [Aspergillus carlsbadensis]|nr:hypothetical protein BJY00DRAFT_265446 [Aspergillus carlsbadensis]